MSDEPTAAVITKMVLDAFSTRAPDLHGITPPGPGVHCVRFDIRGHALDLLTDDASPNVFVLELPKALAIDASQYPGALAKTLELIDLLGGTIDFVAGTTAASPTDDEITHAITTVAGATGRADVAASDTEAATGTTGEVG